jgi:hypothetical protein
MDLSLVTAVVDELFEGAIDPRELVAKMGPDAADVHAPGPMSKKKALRYLPNQSKKVQKGMWRAARIMGTAPSKVKPTTTGLAADKRFYVRSVAAGSALGGAGVGAAAERKHVLRSIENPDRPTLKSRIIQAKTKTKEAFGKDLEWTGQISKIKEEKRQVFGWCSLSKVNGEPVVDLQNDYIPIEETEEAAYTYVLESRKGGDMHKRRAKGGIGKGWDEPVHTSDMIESFVVTPEKMAQMGIKSEKIGWWVGFQINDDAQWEMVKSGERTGFSVHGSGKRTTVGA